jgi:hypothetical protein
MGLRVYSGGPGDLVSSGRLPIERGVRRNIASLCLCGAAWVRPAHLARPSRVVASPSPTGRVPGAACCVRGPKTRHLLLGRPLMIQRGGRQAPRLLLRVRGLSCCYSKDRRQLPRGRAEPSAPRSPRSQTSLSFARTQLRPRVRAISRALAW